jgi:hypothetical protein
MGKFSVNVILVTALVLPVVLFWQLDSHSSLSVPTAAAIAVAVGWALNVTWAFAALKAATRGLPQDDGGTMKIAAAFGWFCPVILVALTWLALRLFAKSIA